MNVYQPEMCLVINLKRSVSGTLTESIVQSVAVEVGSQRADAGRLKVPDVVVERHPELAVRVEADVQLATVSRRDRLPLGGSVRPRAAPLAVTLAPRQVVHTAGHSP